MFPSARASQAIAKCGKAHGDVRRTTKGRNLKRWQKEKWEDKITGEDCGHKGGPEVLPAHKARLQENPGGADRERAQGEDPEEEGGAARCVTAFRGAGANSPL